MESLNNKTALITGAGKGLGKAIALQLAAEGVNLALVSRTATDLEQVSEQARQINPSIKVVYATADVADIAQVNEACSKIKAAIGDVHILINNAGTAKFGKFLDLEVNEWENMVKTNLFGPYYFIKQIFPQMLERKNGDIVNISSSAGLKGSPLTSAYSASKFGLIGLSDSLMQEARKSNIRVFTLTPSTIATDLAIDNKLTDGNPNSTLQPEDFAELLVAHLKLPTRALVKDVSLWSTNP